MLPSIYLFLAFILLLNIVVGSWRVIQGPKPVDRLLAVQLFSTTAIAALLLLAEAIPVPAFRDVALVLALLTIILTLAFISLASSSDISQ